MNRHRGATGIRLCAGPEAGQARCALGAWHGQAALLGLEIRARSRAIQLEVLSAAGLRRAGDLPQVPSTGWRAGARRCRGPSMRVGHPIPHRDALSTEIAIEYLPPPCLWIRMGARMASSTRAIGASETRTGFPK
jgi:hypothetical protein